jgi:hypothetical protein
MADGGATNAEVQSLDPVAPVQARAKEKEVIYDGGVGCCCELTTPPTLLGRSTWAPPTAAPDKLWWLRSQHGVVVQPGARSHHQRGNRDHQGDMLQEN